MTEGLYKGDCIEWLRSLPDGCADFIFMDPPYGHNNNNGDLIHRREEALGHRRVTQDEARPIANDGVEADPLFRSCIRECARVLKPGCCCCCCGGGGGPDPQFARWSLWMDEAFRGGFKQAVVWDKGPMGMGWHYRRSYEIVLVAQKKGAACRWFDDTHRVENIVRARKLIPQADNHPTEKPLELVEHFMRLHTREGDLVLDPFLGSGTTAVACIRLGRRWAGAEITPEYWPIIEARVAHAERTRQPELFGGEVC